MQPRLSSPRLSTIGWGPNLAHYELNHCDICGCRAWRDGRYYIARQSDPSTAQFWLDQQGLANPDQEGHRNAADGVVVSVEAWIFSLLGVWLLIVACTLIFLSGGDE